MTVISMCVGGWEGDMSHLASQGTSKAAFAERCMRNSQEFVLSNGKFYKSEGKSSILLEKEQNWIHRTEQNKKHKRQHETYGNNENNERSILVDINNKNKMNGSKWWQNNPLLFWKKKQIVYLLLTKPTKQLQIN